MTDYVGASARTIASIFVVLASSGQSASDEPSLRQQEVLASKGVVFCSGHADVTLEHMRRVVSDWEIDTKALVSGTSLRERPDPSDLFFVIVEDESIDETLHTCIAAYPPSMKEALDIVVETIGQPVPDDAPLAAFLGPIVGTSRSFREDGWIGKIMVTAFTGADARNVLNDLLFSSD